MPRPVRLLAPLVLAAAVLAGCGGGDVAGNNAYVAKVNAAQDRFARSVQRIQRELDTPTSTPAQDRRALDAFGVAVRRAVDDLRMAAPPATVRALHARLVAALASYGPVIAARLAVADSPDPRRLLQATTRFSTQSDAVTVRIQRAIAQINAKLTS